MAYSDFRTARTGSTVKVGTGTYTVTYRRINKATRVLTVVATLETDGTEHVFSFKV